MLGAPVSGEEFFDREKLLQKIKQLAPRAHIALLGPRGCGKTSIMLQLCQEIEEMVPVYVDLAHVAPKNHIFVLRKLGREVLRAVVRERGLLRSMPDLVRKQAAKVADFVRENLRVSIGDWITMYFDSNVDLTEFMEETFSTIEGYGMRLLVMLDEVTSTVRLSGTKPKDEDMDFMEALRSHISRAKSAHYVLAGSQTGLMELITQAKFGRLLVSIRVAGLEEKGARELVHTKLGSEVEEKFIQELFERTRLWPLYLQAYCLAAHLSGEKGVRKLDKTVFELLYGHFSYLEKQLSELELMIMLKLGDGRVSEIAKRVGSSYYNVLSAIRTLSLKGFLEKRAPGTYGPVDPLFPIWLRNQYGEVD